MSPNRIYLTFTRSLLALCLKTNLSASKKRLATLNNVCFLCVCFLPIYSGHQVRWTYQPGSHRISHPPSFCGACLNFSRENDSFLFLVDRDVEFCVCMCVCLFSSHSSCWTSSSLDIPAGVTQEEGHTGFFIHLPSALRALIFIARRIQPFLSLVDREVEFWNFVYKRISRSPLVGHFFFFFERRKIPFAGIELTSQRVRRL